MPIHSRFQFLLFTILILLSACSTVPRIDENSISSADAQKWMTQYCSSLNPAALSERELSGELVMKSSTKEFKGQFPATIHYEKSGKFVMEATNILGGTVLRLDGDAQAMNISVPSKPQFNRSGITQYLGLELPVLIQLLHGDLPCPSGKNGERVVRVEKNAILSESALWKWRFERAGVADHFVPVLLSLTSKNQAAPIEIRMTIDDWDRDQNYAKKVKVKSPEGELKWTWRGREL